MNIVEGMIGNNVLIVSHGDIDIVANPAIQTAG